MSLMMMMKVLIPCNFVLLLSLSSRVLVHGDVGKPVDYSSEQDVNSNSETLSAHQPLEDVEKSAENSGAPYVQAMSATLNTVDIHKPTQNQEETADISEQSVSEHESQTTHEADFGLTSVEHQPQASRIVVVGAAAGGAAAPVVVPQEDATQDSHIERESQPSGATVPEVTPTLASGQEASSSASEGEPVVSDGPVEGEATPHQAAHTGGDSGHSASQHHSSLSTSHPPPPSPSTLQASQTLPIMDADPLEVTPSPDWDGLGGRVVEVIGESSKVDPPETEKSEGSEEEFPTFDKWSAQYLKEQEMQKEKEGVEPVVKLSQKKLRQNFASEVCGAKILSSNAEAEHSSFLLNGNPDEYMISPCKAKKWFVLELCEPVQIHKVELGTVELFSSPPKSFRLWSSARYPSKEWKDMGTYSLSPERVVQSFATPLLADSPYVKFVKVEMLEHHGSEHYCPITTFKVLGLDLSSDEDDEHLESEGHPDITNEEAEDEIGEAVNLFKSAKDTVVKLVQKVLYKGEEEEAKENVTAQTDNQTVESPPDQVVEKKVEEVPPCPDKLAVGSSEHPAPVDLSPPCSQALHSSPPDSATSEEPPIVTKLGESDQLPAEGSVPMVIKLDPEETTPASVCPRETAWWRDVCVLGQVSDHDLLTLSQTSQPHMQSAPDSSTPASPPLSESPGKSEEASQASEERQDTLYSSQSSGHSVQPAMSQSLEPSSLTPDPDNESSVTLTPGLLHIQQSRVLEHSASDPEQSIFLKVSPSPTSLSEDSQDAGGMEPVPETNSASELPQLAHQADVTTPHADMGQQTGSGEGAEVKGEGQAANGSDPSVTPGSRRPDLVKVTMGAGGKRDVSIVKLSNRIVSLEQNVSMTKQYLEGLSKAFKQQTEELMRLVNKTEKRLNTQVAWSEEKDVQCQSQVHTLEGQLVNLTLTVSSMQAEIDSMTQRLGDRQMVLSAVQVLLVLWMILMACCQGPKHHNSDSEQVKTSQSTSAPSTPSDSTSRMGSNPLWASLRSSESDLPCAANSATDLSAMKRLASDSDIASSLVPALTAPQPSSQGSKKKKRKKPKTGLGNDASNPPAQSPSFSNSAGVLFGSSLAPSSSAADNSIRGDVESDKSDKENRQTERQEERGFPHTARDQPFTGTTLHKVSPLSAELSANSQNRQVSGPAPKGPVDAGGTCTGKGSLLFSQSRGTSDAQAKSLASLVNSSEALDKKPNSPNVPSFSPHRLSAASRSPLGKKSSEFKLPAYHRHKVRRLGGRMGNNVSQNAHPVFPRPELFNWEDYLSENRFKFSSSPSPPDQDPLLSWYPTADRSDHPKPPCIHCNGFGTPSTFQPSPSTSSGVRMSGSPLVSSLANQSSSQSQFHRQSTTRHEDPRLPCSHTGARGFAEPADTRHTDSTTHRGHTEGTRKAHTDTLKGHIVTGKTHAETTSNFSSRANVESSTNKAQTQSNSSHKGQTTEWSGGRKKQGHHRQGSLPLTDKTATETLTSPEVGRERQGSLEGFKATSRLSSGGGGRVRKSPSNPTIHSGGKR